jgi:nucleoside-diphosphate-sugar epimerase
VKVFVAGATGVLGRNAIPALVRAGHAVRGTARGSEKAEVVRSLGAEPVEVDLFDAAAVRDAVAGSEAVLHLATKIPPIMKMRSARAWAENDRLRGEASRNLVDAALAAGTQAFVQESITFLYASGGDNWLSEDAPIDASWIALRSMQKAEQETARFSGAGGRGVSLRFAAFYGPDAASTAETVKMARRRMFPVIGKGDNFLSSIHVADAGAAVTAALSLPAGAYNVADDEPLRMREYAQALTQAFGLPKPWRIPAWLGKLVLGGPGRYILRSQRVSSGRFKEASGWSPKHRSVREGYAAIAAEWRDGGTGR